MVYGLRGHRPLVTHPAARRAPITAAVRESIAAEARAFVGQRYGLDAEQLRRLAALPIVWQTGRQVLRGTCYCGPARGQAGPHIRLGIPAGPTATRSLYKRRTARLTTPPGGLEMPVRFALALTLVHEYTHALQYGIAGTEIKVRRGEVEPTRCEIEYLRVRAPELYAALVAVEPDQGRRRQQRSRRQTTRNQTSAARSPRDPPSRLAPLARLLRWLRLRS